MREQSIPQNVISIRSSLSRNRAVKAVNAELIRMYWNVGEYLSALCTDAAFGDKVVDEVTSYIASSGTSFAALCRGALFPLGRFCLG